VRLLQSLTEFDRRTSLRRRRLGTASAHVRCPCRDRQQDMPMEPGMHHPRAAPSFVRASLGFMTSTTLLATAMVLVAAL
jgi:hypothetical protein